LAEALIVESWSVNCLRSPQQCKSRDRVCQMLEQQQETWMMLGAHSQASQTHVHSPRAQKAAALGASESKGGPLEEG